GSWHEFLRRGTPGLPRALAFHRRSNALPASSAPHEAAGPHDELGAAGFVALEVHGDQPVYHVALPLAHADHLDRGGARHHPEFRRVLHQRRDLRAPDLVLARQTVDVRTGAADPSPLHDDGAAPRFGPMCHARYLPPSPLPRTRTSTRSAG